MGNNDVMPKLIDDRAHGYKITTNTLIADYDEVSIRRLRMSDHKLFKMSRVLIG
jgi:hypothetical protein